MRNCLQGPVVLQSRMVMRHRGIDRRVEEVCFRVRPRILWRDCWRFSWSRPWRRCLIPTPLTSTFSPYEIHKASGGKVSSRKQSERLACGIAAQTLALRNLSAFEMTDAELKLIASAAIIGESSNPVNG